MTVNQFGTFFSIILSNIASFLMTAPIIYFVGLFILAFVVGMLGRLIHISR